MVSGKKDSATPLVRRWLHVTDKCQICPQREAAIATMQNLISEVKDDSLQTTLDHVVKVTEESDNPNVGRQD